MMIKLPLFLGLICRHINWWVNSRVELFLCMLLVCWLRLGRNHRIIVVFLGGKDPFCCLLREEGRSIVLHSLFGRRWTCFQVISELTFHLEIDTEGSYRSACIKSCFSEFWNSLRKSMNSSFISLSHRLKLEDCCLFLGSLWIHWKLGFLQSFWGKYRIFFHPSQMSL